MGCDDDENAAADEAAAAATKIVHNNFMVERSLCQRVVWLHYLCLSDYGRGKHHYRTSAMAFMEMEGHKTHK